MKTILYESEVKGEEGSNNNGDGGLRPLWEAIWPVADNNGVIFGEDHHAAIRRIVCSVSGGLTWNPTLEGEWEHEGKLYREPMIGIQFRATRVEAESIAIIARKYYRQIEIMVHKIADASDIIFVDANGVRK
jgi:hypothetical protein